MLIQLIIFFSIILIAYVSIGKFDRLKLNITNFLLILYFLANIVLGFFGFKNDIYLNIFGYNLFHISLLESFFLLIFGIVGIGVSIYSNYYFGEYLHHKKNLNFYYMMIVLFFFSMQTIIICSNAIIFLVMWELMTLSSYFLVIHEYKTNGSFEGGNYYLIIAHIGMFFILFSFIPFIINSGSFDFIKWNGLSMSENLRNIAFFSALIGFGAKAGIWPLDIWLPKAHPIAPSNISSIMSGFMVKLPIMMLLKFILFFFALKLNLYWGITLLVIGSISAFLGIFYAITQNDIKRILAFSTIENIGFITATLGVFVIGITINNNIIAILGFTALLYHIFNHSMYKTLMFMIAGSIIERTGTRNISKLGGLIKIIPFLGIVTLIGILAISGIPPFSSFNSELNGIMGILLIILDSNNSFLQFVSVGSIVLIALMSIFSFICFARLYSIVFVGRQRDKELTINKIFSFSEQFSYIYFLVFIFIVSILPGIFFNFANRILYGNTNTINLTILKIGNFEFKPIYLIISYILLFGIIYLIYRRYLRKIVYIEPWNCGYDHIPHRSQYSPRSLVQPIRRVYEGIYMQVSNVEYNDLYKQNRNVLKFLKSKAYFTDIFYNKFISLINYLASKLRQLQNGILQFYIGYLFGMLILLLLVLYYNL